MGPARIYPWTKMRRSRAPSIAPGTFFVAQSWADCITNMAGFDLRQAQQREEQTLDAMAGSRASLRGAVQQLQRVQQGRGRRHLVRVRRDAPPRLLRRDLGQLECGPEDQGSRDHQRPLRVPNTGAERRGARYPPQGN